VRWRITADGSLLPAGRAEKKNVTVAVMAGFRPA